MRKCNKFAVLLAAALCLGLAACGGSSSTASSGDASGAASAAASSAASEAASTEENGVICPAESFDGTNLKVEIADPMADGSDYPAGFESTAVEENDSGFNITVTLYDYDVYSYDDINGLKVGDTIRAHTGNGEETRDIKIETLESGEQYITINGGIENGGMYLTKGENLVRATGMDDHPIYYEVGETVLELASDAVLSDSSADYGAEAVETTGASAVAEAIVADEVGFSCYNTKLTLQNGEITKITRVWIP